MLPKIFGNDFRTLARIEPEVLAVAKMNDKSVLPKQLNRMVMLMCDGLGGGGGEALEAQKQVRKHIPQPPTLLAHS